MSNNTNTEYLNKYWVKAPYLDQKKFFMTKQGLKDYLFKVAEEEFGYSFLRYYGFQETKRRLRARGYNFSHNVQ